MASLYIHIPFCAQKCLYCDFVSYPNRLEWAERYVSCVIREADAWEGMQADTVYLGGGTPGILPVGLMTKLIQGVGEKIDLSHAKEFTIETNPGLLTPAKAEEYLAAGADRLSMGLQAAQAHHLKNLGRIHSLNDFITGVEIARKAGFARLNGDMMYALPQQTMEEVRETASLLASLPLTHVSAYALRLEEGVPLYGTPQPDDDTTALMLEEICRILEEKGLLRYEISNFARPGEESLHNLCYWRCGEYIGLGAGAHSCLNGIRFYNASGLAEYMEAVEGGQSPCAGREQREPLKEQIMLRTRIREGLPLTLVPSSEKWDKTVALLVKNGLARMQQGNLVLTDRGMDVQNGVVLHLWEAAGLGD